MGGTGWLLAALLLAGPTGGPDPDTTALVGVGVADVDAGRVVPAQTVVVADGRIVARQPADATLDPWVRIIEGGGLTLVPGLVDSHVHSDSLGLGLFLANGVTAVREMNGAQRHLRWRDDIEAGRLVGPRMLVTSELLTGTPFQGVRFRLVDGVDDARTAAREAAVAGYDFLKIYDGLSAEEYAVLVEEARASGLALTGHVPSDVGLSGVLAAGQGLEHAEKIVVDVLGHAFDDPAPLAAAMDAIAAAGVPVTPTLAVHEILTATGDRIVRLRNAPELGLVSAGTRGWWATVSNRDPTPPGVETRGTRFMSAQRTLVRGLMERGVPVLAGTDTPNPLMVPGYSLHEELDALVRAGLTPRQALAAATTVPADVLPFGPPTGRIDAGYAADLVAVDGDPFEDLAVLRSPHGVMAAGRWYDRNELDGFLDAARAARAPKNEDDQGGAP